MKVKSHSSPLADANTYTVEEADKAGFIFHVVFPLGRQNLIFLFSNSVKYTVISIKYYVNFNGFRRSFGPLGLSRQCRMLRVSLM